MEQGQAQVAAPSVEERLDAAVSNFIQPPEEQTEEPPETPDAQEAETQEVPEEQTEEIQHEIPEIEWDKIKDAKIEVSVRGEKEEVSLEEARLGYMRTTDYQKKTAELAQQRRSVVDEASKTVSTIQEQYVNQLNTLEQAVQKLAMQELANVDMNWLAETDPNAYVRAQHRYNQFNQVLQSLQTESQKIQEQRSREAQTVRAQMLEQGMAELKTRIPNFNEEVKNHLFKAGSDYGFSKDELSSISDPRLLHVLNDARQFREISASKPQTLNKASQAPKVIKPGSKPAIKQDNKGQELKQRIKKSGGKDDDALEAFIKRTLR